MGGRTNSICFSLPCKGVVQMPIAAVAHTAAVIGELVSFATRVTYYLRRIFLLHWQEIIFQSMFKTVTVARQLFSTSQLHDSCSRHTQLHDSCSSDPCSKPVYSCTTAVPSRRSTVARQLFPGSTVARQLFPLPLIHSCTTAVPRIHSCTPAVPTLPSQLHDSCSLPQLHDSCSFHPQLHDSCFFLGPVIYSCTTAVPEFTVARQLLSPVTVARQLSLCSSQLHVSCYFSTGPDSCNKQL